MHASNVNVRNRSRPDLRIAISSPVGAQSLLSVAEQVRFRLEQPLQVWPEHSQLLEKIIECRPSVIVEHEPLTVRTAPPASLIPHGHAATEARVTLQAVQAVGVSL